MPMINQATDAGYKQRFKILHDASVVLTLAYIGAAATVVVRLANDPLSISFYPTATGPSQHGLLETPDTYTLADSQNACDSIKADLHTLSQSPSWSSSRHNAKRRSAQAEQHRRQ